MCDHFNQCVVNLTILHTYIHTNHAVTWHVNISILISHMKRTKVSTLLLFFVVCFNDASSFITIYIELLSMCDHFNQCVVNLTIPHTYLPTYIHVVGTFNPIGNFDQQNAIGDHTNIWNLSQSSWDIGSSMTIYQCGSFVDVPWRNIGFKWRAIITQDLYAHKECLIQYACLISFSSFKVKFEMEKL